MMQMTRSLDGLCLFGLLTILLCASPMSGPIPNETPGSPDLAVAHDTQGVGPLTDAGPWDGAAGDDAPVDSAPADGDSTEVDAADDATPCSATGPCPDDTSPRTNSACVKRHTIRSTPRHN